MRPGEADEWVEGLNEILCRNHFQLKTLYCNEGLDISKIIKSRPELQELGIYTNGGTEDVLKPLKEFQTAGTHLPLVFTLERESFYPTFDHIGIFPAFYPADQNATLHHTLGDSMGCDLGSDMLANPKKVSQLSIYLGHANDMQIVHTIAENMASIFQGIKWLNLYLESRFDISLQDMNELLSFYPQLSELNFYRWNNEEGDTDLDVPENIKLSSVKQWVEICPELISVTFSDGETTERNSNTDDWRVRR
ncbi:hypothetical protein CPB84DRAFT_1855079 [Gymnopilus junonius]|uniref:Uncharacterized protein n=1 Tax=Gymnopilus junonius TaxID=109634 RepID=A0A9P5TGA9_GYMJU|nr:hypothetical protein CPB84DRAFT_1855079 [Gymnopilus junonius]